MASRQNTIAKHIRLLECSHDRRRSGKHYMPARVCFPLCLPSPALHRLPVTPLRRSLPLPSAPSLSAPPPSPLPPLPSSPASLLSQHSPASPALSALRPLPSRPLAACAGTHVLQAREVAHSKPPDALLTCRSLQSAPPEPRSSRPGARRHGAPALRELGTPIKPALVHPVLPEDHVARAVRARENTSRSGLGSPDLAHALGFRSRRWQIWRLESRIARGRTGQGCAAHLRGCVLALPLANRSLRPSRPLRLRPGRRRGLRAGVAVVRWTLMRPRLPRRCDSGRARR